MKIAAIDIGTNTIRLLIGSMKKGRLIRVASERAVTRLGKDLMKTGLLSDGSINKSMAALRSFKEICDKYDVKKILAAGTSALREAGNSAGFLSEVKKETGIDIEIISGEREAELTVRGVTAGFWEKKPDNFFIIDIGGGSIEWIFYKDSSQESVSRSQEKTKNTKLNLSFLLGSLPVGAVKLLETFIKHDPPAPAELDECRNFIRSQISGLFDSSLITHHSSLSLIATGGTPATLAAIDLGLEEYAGDRVHMHRISIESLEKIFYKLVNLPIEKRNKVKGMGPDRADIIVPGALVLAAIMEYMKAKETIISDYGLLEGLLVEQAATWT